MSVDRLSNMLSDLKNAALARKSYIETFYSKECEGVANVLKEAGFLEDVKIFKEKGNSYKSLRLDLAKQDGQIKITDVKRLSKPGRRQYGGNSDIKPVVGGYGVLIVSTSRGIMSGLEARKKKLGGELICKVY